MNYTPKGDVRDKMKRGRRNMHMRGRQDDVVVIVVVIRSSPQLSLSPASSRLVEAEYRAACCTTMGMRPSSLFLTMYHPRHHRPCRPHPLLHHRRCCLPATLVTVAIALAVLFVAVLIIGHLLLLFVVMSPTVVLMSIARLRHSRR